MAEGGMAAAMGNVSSEDNWMVHFRDTMRGGKMLNNYRMASCTPRSHRPACSSSSSGVRSSTAPRKARSSSATSAGTATRASRTWATAPGSS